jgi:hypothetical protein
VSDAVFAIGESAVFPMLSPTDMLSSSGLLVPAEGGFVVLAGIHTGVVDVEVQALLEAPDEVATAPWEEVVDVSFESDGDLGVTSMASFSYQELPRLTATGPGWYRVRAHAVGRDLAWDGVAEDPVEHYLFLAWPAPQEPETVHQATDRFGRRHRARVESMS